MTLRSDISRRDATFPPGVAGSGKLRCGFTLIEMMVVISFGSSVMLTAIALAHTALTLQSQAQVRFERSFTLDRFIEGFRRDVYLAHRAELSSQQSLTLFLADGRRVEYRSEADQLTRRENDAAGAQIAEAIQTTPPAAAAADTAADTAPLEQVQLTAGSQVRFSRDATSRCLILEVVDQVIDTPKSTTPSAAAAADAGADANADLSTVAAPYRLTRQIVVSLGQDVPEAADADHTHADLQEQS